MKLTLLPLILNLLFFAPYSYAAEPCPGRNLPQKSLANLELQSCQQKKASSECQALYKEIAESGEDVGERALRCELDADSSAGEALAVSYIGCLRGGVVHGIAGSVKSLGKMIGETTAKAVISLQADTERLEYCDKHPEHKAAIFTTYNSTVPSLLKVPVPSPEKLKLASCAKLETDLYRLKSEKARSANQFQDFKLYQKNPSFLNSAEKEYYDWKKSQPEFANRPDQSAWDSVKKILHQMKIRSECYKRETRWALYCETAFFVASGGTASVKLLSRISGLKGIRFAKDVKKIQEAGGLKNMTEAEKLDLLRKANSLSSSDRIAAAERLTGKVLSPQDADKLIDIHKIPLGKTEKEYRLALRAKAKGLKELGYSADEAQVLMRSGVTGNFDEYIEAHLAAQTLEDRRYQEVTALERKKISLEYQLKSKDLTPDAQRKLQEDLTALEAKIDKTRSDLIGNSSNNVASDFLESQVGKKSIDIEVYEAVNGKQAPTIFYQRRAKDLRELAELKATDKSYQAAQKDFELAAKDIDKVYANAGPKDLRDKLEALQILENAGNSGRSTQAYQTLVDEIAQSVISKGGSPSKLEFSQPAVSATTANQQKDSVWALAREFKEQTIRIEVQRARNEKVAGHSWENSQRLNKEFEDMIEKREQIKKAAENQLRRDLGATRATEAQRTLEQLGFGI